MSHYVKFTGRSRNHALELLEANKTYLPHPVFEFIAIAINNLPPAREGFQRIVHVETNGHLHTDDAGSSSSASALIKVEQTEIAD